MPMFLALEFHNIGVRRCTDPRVSAFPIPAKEHCSFTPISVNLGCPIPYKPVWPLRRLLESQLQSQKRSHENEAEALRGEIQSLKEENNRQQQLLAQNLQLPPEARIEASLQHEITRLTNENLVSRVAVPQSAVCCFWTSTALPCWERCSSVSDRKGNMKMLVEMIQSNETTLRLFLTAVSWRIEPSQTLPVVSGRKSPDYVLGFKYQRDTATNYFTLIPRIQ